MAQNPFSSPRDNQHGATSLPLTPIPQPPQAMVKPARESKVMAGQTPRVAKAHKLLRRSKARARLRHLFWRSLKKQPGTGSAEAGSQGSSQDQGRLSPSEEGKLDDFIKTGRTGRRNAVPVITEDAGAMVSTADLPMDLDKLSCTEKNQSTSPAEATKPAS